MYTRHTSHFHVRVALGLPGCLGVGLGRGCLVLNHISERAAVHAETALSRRGCVEPLPPSPPSIGLDLGAAKSPRPHLCAVNDQ